MSAAHFQNPVAQALQAAMLATASIANPEHLDFQSEINQRLEWAKGLAMLLADAANAANLDGSVPFAPDGLYVCALLLHNEIQTVGYLHDALQHCLNEGVAR